MVIIQRDSTRPTSSPYRSPTRRTWISPPKRLLPDSPTKGYQGAGRRNPVTPTSVSQHGLSRSEDNPFDGQHDPVDSPLQEQYTQAHRLPVLRRRDQVCGLGGSRNKQQRRWARQEEESIGTNITKELSTIVDDANRQGIPTSADRIENELREKGIEKSTGTITRYLRAEGYFWGKGTRQHEMNDAPANVMPDQGRQPIVVMFAAFVVCYNDDTRPMEVKDSVHIWPSIGKAHLRKRDEDADLWNNAPDKVRQARVIATDNDYHGNFNDIPASSKGEGREPTKAELLAGQAHERKAVSKEQAFQHSAHDSEKACQGYDIRISLVVIGFLSNPVVTCNLIVTCSLVVRTVAINVNTPSHTARGTAATYRTGPREKAQKTKPLDDEDKKLMKEALEYGCNERLKKDVAKAVAKFPRIPPAPAQTSRTIPPRSQHGTDHKQMTPLEA
ncbi:hypothetical protein B0O80DRAFT_499528 [Mortierella sp. GBAus27b]|nr:hypothetical protein B0O80DRAFT_499528 [Mortierella sp. GBAus27b]